MRDHSETTLGAAIKSLRDAVAPAVDPSDPQAVEQLRLTVDFLEFLQLRLYDLHPRHRFELGHQLATGRALLDDAGQVSTDAQERLATAVTDAEAAYGSPDTSTRELRAASESLWAAVRGVIREAATTPPELRERISAAVRTGMAPLVAMETSWYLPFGFDPAPGSAPDLAALLASPEPA